MENIMNKCSMNDLCEGITCTENTRLIKNEQRTVQSQLFIEFEQQYCYCSNFAIVQTIGRSDD